MLIYFGSESTIRENVSKEKDKAVKNNTLIADAVVFQNFINSTKIIIDFKPVSRRAYQKIRQLHCGYELNPTTF